MAITARSVTTGAAIVAGAAIVIAVVGGAIAQGADPGTTRYAWIPVWDPATSPQEHHADVDPPRVTKNQYDALVAQVRATDPAATEEVVVMLRLDDASVTTKGVDPVPEPFLVEGALPSSGEVVLRKTMADELGLGIGDTLPLDQDVPWDAPVEDLPFDSLEVVGLASPEPVEDELPAKAWVSIDDSWELGHVYGIPSPEGPVVIDTYLTWHGDVPAEIEPWVLAD